MNVNVGLLQLHAALKAVRLRWDETKLSWSDSVRKEFEENHWDPLIAQVMATERAMEHLSHMVGQMQQDCR
jgi:hypothetical protein